MAFDAGSVDAKLTIDTSAFDRSLAKAKADVKRFEDETHKVRIAAVFDQSSLTRARKLFSDLDNSVSKDAMNRLRSSPQGSVLGSLNALFSPHPVTGAPSPAQAASQGLLGKMTGGAPGGKVTTQQIIRNVIGVDDTQAKAAGARAGKDAADAASAAAGQEAKKRGGLLGGLFGMFGGGGGGNSGGGGGKSGGKGGGGGNPLDSGLLGGIGPGILGINTKWAGIIGGGAAALGGAPTLLGAGAGLGAAGLGVGLLAKAFGGITATLKPFTSQYQAIQVAQQRAVTPAQQAAVAKSQASLNQAVSTLTPAQKSIYNTTNALSDQWQNFTTSLAPSLAGAYAKMPAIISSLFPLFTASVKFAQPLIQGLTSISSQVVPGLVKVLGAAAPLLLPLMKGLGGLIGGLLPGLVTILKAAMPAVTAFAQGLGTLGKDLGGLLSAVAPAIKASTPIFTALIDLLGALFPVVGKLAAIMANALGPVFVTLAGVIKSLLPFLTVIGKVLASLAGAVIGTLVSAFGALAKLLITIAPALNGFATAISGVFTVLENTGVFAILGNAIEALAVPLGEMINALLKGLTPLLPPLIGFLSQVVTILAAGLAGALLAVIPPLTNLAVNVLAAIALVLPVILPLLTAMLGLFTTATVGAVSGVAVALNAIITAIPPAALRAIVIGLAGLYAAFKVLAAAKFIIEGVRFAILVFQSSTEVAAAKSAVAWVVSSAKIVAAFIAQAAAATAAFIAENLATLGIIAGIGLLVAGIIYLATHWRQVWGEVKRLAMDAWNFLTHGWGQWIIPGLTLIRLAVGFVRDHWRQAWFDIRSDASNLWQWLWTDFGQKIYRFFTQTIPGWLGSFGNAVRNTFNSVTSWLGGVPGMFGRALSSLGGLMLGIGRSAIGGLLGGITAALSGIGNWVNSNIVQPIIGAVKSFFGINSPSTVMAGIGGHLVSGLIKGLLTSGRGLSSIVGKVFGDMPHALLDLLEKGIGGITSLPGKAISALKGLGGDALSVLQSIGSVATGIWDSIFGGGSGGSGVAQWKGVVDKALSMLGLSQSLEGQVLFQMQTESGGAVNAINLTDSNAAAGTPSKGLLQVIDPTFNAYHVPGTSGNIYDPLANVAAAINYARARYGPTLMSGGMGMGSGHGYALGGLISEPVIGYGVNSGQRYTLGENGPEWVTPGKGPPSGSGGSKLADSISLMLPEGTAVATALSELTWYLQTAKMRQVIP